LNIRFNIQYALRLRGDIHSFFGISSLGARRTADAARWRQCHRRPLLLPHTSARLSRCRRQNNEAASIVLLPVVVVVVVVVVVLLNSNQESNRRRCLLCLLLQ